MSYSNTRRGICQANNEHLFNLISINLLAESDMLFIPYDIGQVKSLLVNRGYRKRIKRIRSPDGYKLVAFLESSTKHTEPWRIPAVLRTPFLYYLYQWWRNLAEALRTLIHLTLCYSEPFPKASAKPMASHSIPSYFPILSK